MKIKHFVSRAVDVMFTAMVLTLAMGGCRPAMAIDPPGDNPPGLELSNSIALYVPQSAAETLEIRIEGLQSEIKKLAAALDAITIELRDTQAKLAAVRSCKCEPTAAKPPAVKPAAKPAAAEQPVIEFYTAKNFVCPPCELWKKNERPRFAAAGWNVVTFLVESGPVPRFTIRRNGQVAERVGSVNVETATALTK